MSRFVTERVLRFGDCDPAGIAYFPRYFDMLNGVVEEWWGDLGFPWSRLIGERRLGLPTVRFETDFRAPALHGDRLRFSLGIDDVGSRSLTLSHLIHRADTLL